MEATQRRQEVITASRVKYATPRTEVEAALRSVVEAEPAAGRVVKEREVVEKKPREPEPPPAKSEVPAPPPIPSIPVPATKPSTVSEPRSPESPADLGRGGVQHKAIQLRIKQAAEPLGFRTVIEKQILDGQGSVDLLLERGDLTIACEISITTTIDHEVGNEEDPLPLPASQRRHYRPQPRCRIRPFQLVHRRSAPGR